VDAASGANLYAKQRILNNMGTHRYVLLQTSTTLGGTLNNGPSFDTYCACLTAGLLSYQRREHGGWWRGGDDT
jgi:hypothetical protein